VGVFGELAEPHFDVVHFRTLDQFFVDLLLEFVRPLADVVLVADASKSLLLACLAFDIENSSAPEINLPSRDRHLSSRIHSCRIVMTSSSVRSPSPRVYAFLLSKLSVVTSPSIERAAIEPNWA
jgi:hypothetical protein